MKTPSPSRSSDSSPQFTAASVPLGICRKRSTRRWLVAAFSVALAGTSPAQVPQLINYQGRVAVGGVNFDGTGRFKFALVNADTPPAIYWLNSADTTPQDGVPDAAVELTVTKGLYSVLLGENMTAIPAAVWTHSDVRLRVWFDDGTANGPQLLSPDQRIAAVGYAMMAGNVPDGAITSAKIENGAVGALQLGENAVQAGHLAAGAVGSAQLAPGVRASPLEISGSSQDAVANTAYLATSATPTSIKLPDVANVGDTIQITGAGTGGWNASCYTLWTARENNRMWRSIACSADGTKLVAACISDQLYTSVDSGVTWTARAGFNAWQSVASSADGTKLVAATWGGQLFTSADSGVTWSPHENGRYWRCVASSADGTKLVAVASPSEIYTSADSGETWVARETSREWYSVASSADGTRLAAVVCRGQIYTSADSGVTWTAHETNRDWQWIASSADGVKLVAAVTNGQIYTSADAGTTWTARESARLWKSVASSADGSLLVAAAGGGQIHLSTNSGATWLACDSARNWLSVACSADGRMLAGVVDQGQIYTSGVAIYAAGAQGETTTLQYMGDGNWRAVAETAIAAGAVGSAQLADNSVGSGKLTAGAVQSNHIADGAVTNEKLANSNITLNTATGLTGGGTVPLGGSLTLSNSGVLSLTGGGGVTVSGSNGAVTLGSTAQSANGANTIVRRDGNGDFSTRSIALSGNLAFPDTTSPTIGLVSLGGNPFLHAFGANNTFLGTHAGNFTMSGSANTAVGASTLTANTSGFCNVVSGFWTLASNTTGNYNTANGTQALGSNTTGSYNTAYGALALSSNTTGTDNIALGLGAGSNLTNGNNNIDIGHPGVAGESDIIRIGNNQTDTYLAGVLRCGTASLTGNLALPSTTGSSVGFVSLGGSSFLHAFGSENTFVGTNAGNFTMTGPANTATGYQTLKANTTGNFNTATGHEALLYNTAGFRNTATGNGAMFKNTIGGYNTATGCDALYYNTSGESNTSAGCLALVSNTTGSHNIALGYQAGQNLTTGNNNIDIGHPGVAGESDIIRIGTSQTDTYLAGTLHGDGSGLTNIPASAVTGSIPASQVVTAPPGMVLIPAGVFTMGDSLDGIANAIPTVPVTLSAFYIAVDVVTLSQWQAVYFWATSHGYGFNAGAGKSANHPVHTVTWNDVVKWCNARSEMEGLTPVYYTDTAQTKIYKTGNVTVTNAMVKWSANGYRLPTEAEWEKAARGGLAGQRFPWGNTITQNLANYCGETTYYSYDLGPNGYHPLGNDGTMPYTTAVGTFAPNGYGLHDMAGNVSEWCWDWYGTPYAGGSDPHGPTSGTVRVRRGGSWGGYANSCRTAYRSDSDPDNLINLVGFRPARSSVP